MPAHQEIWAYLIVHHAISVLIANASAAANLGPDRISFTKTLRMICRSHRDGAFPFGTGPITAVSSQVVGKVVR